MTNKDKFKYPLEIQIFASLALIKVIPSARVVALSHLKGILINFINSNHNRTNMGQTEIFKEMLSELLNSIKTFNYYLRNQSKEYQIAFENTEYLRIWSLSIL